MSHLYADPCCPQCHGSGSIYTVVHTDDGELEEHRECLCVYRNMILAKLKKVNQDLPKYLPNMKKSSLNGRMEKNLVIYGPYETFLRHLNFALIRKYTRENIEYQCKIVTDLDLIHERFENESTSFLRSLKTPDLLVIVARNLWYENKAAPGYFLESIMQRPYSGGTWIYLPRKLGSNFYFYSHELELYLKENFKGITLGEKSDKKSSKSKSSSNNGNPLGGCKDL